MKTAYKHTNSFALKFFFGFIVLISFSCIAFAQGSSVNASASSEAPEKISVYELIVNQGGPIIYPLALISVVTVVLIFFFLITIRARRVVSDRFMRSAEILIRKEDYLGLINECTRTNQSMARIAENAVEFMTKNTGVSIDEVREVALAEGSRQSSMLNNRISYLSDIGSIATMLGLLGTVIGMIDTFISISQGNVDGVKQMEVAQGVYPALITTGMGLSIGIVALLFYSIFRGRVQKFNSDLESASTHLMAMLAAQHGKTASVAASRSQENETVYDDDTLLPLQEGYQGHTSSRL